MIAIFPAGLPGLDAEMKGNPDSNPGTWMLGDRIIWWIILSGVMPKLILSDRILVVSSGHGPRALRPSEK
jgi:hypothetical protein